mmetsp:Transcript_4906/g.9362  ORF Transcript_4906/g.9362 Transcript_4906/m.9362 type:complete len:540 (+) Transcript_4906:90-1709(+)
MEENVEEKRRQRNQEVFGGRSASSHMLAQLEKRRCYNMRFDRYMDSGYHGMRDYAHKKWTISTSVQLDVALSDAEVTCMEFDSQGVLLALADDKGYIRIFDFDEVNAADVSAKQRKTSCRAEQTKKVEPFITFRTGNDRISTIKWNPFDENLLGVTFFNKDEVRIYDLSRVPDNRTVYTSLTNNNQSSSNIGVLSLVFQSFNKVITGGTNGTLCYWQYYSPSQNKKSRVIWAFNPWNCKIGQCGGITAIVPLSSTRRTGNKDGFLLVSTSIGHFAVIDMDQFSSKAFSSKPTPTVLKIWNLSQLAGLRKHVLPPGTWMGVKKIYVWADKPKVITSDASSTCETAMLVDIAVITNGGWVITLKFDIANNNTPFETPRARVLHRSPHVIQCDSTQTHFYKDSNPRASVPYFPSVYGKLDEGASWLVVTKTQPIYEVLPDCDKRILSQSIGSGGLIYSTTKNDEPDGLSVIHRNWGEQFTIPIQGKLKQLSIHPDNEWIVAYLDLPDGQQIIKLLSLRNLNNSKRQKRNEKNPKSPTKVKPS